MEIKNSSISDVQNILTLYDTAISYQNEKKGLPWPTLERELIETEVKENRQWQLLIDNEIACIWVTTFDDPEIWGDKNADPSVYLHRIATNPKFRGQNIVSKVIDWAKEFAVQNKKEYLRLDTASINPGLITMYVRNGFKFISIIEMRESNKLPSHYHNASVCLFEIKLNKN
ncbi:GNAT family N-acetyltransferase [Flavobacterium aestivum]|uniref:GNAT family N-acetyltransferase n=1 Tax=Flavobacterium aestivum TaxID=3003257 RepID=UPI002482431F|nr:GNAT family N-acetyltransferase [Flavobacterium aestivum]